MAEFDNELPSNEGMLALNNNGDDVCIGEKQTMLNKEIEKLNSVKRDVFSSPPRIIKTILDEISSNLIIQTPGHNMTCHNKSHAKVGGTGFGKSHDKRC